MPTLVTKTVKPGGGGDYTDLNTALQTEARDITAATGTDDIARFDCYPGEDTTRVVISGDGWVTSPGNYVELRFVDSGGTPAYTATWNTNLYRLVNDVGSSIQAFSNFEISHLWHTEGTFQVYVGDIHSSSSQSGAIEVKDSAGAGWNRFDGGGIIVLNPDQADSHVKGCKVDTGSDQSIRFRNWLCYGGETAQPSDFTEGWQVVLGGGGTFELDNCMADDVTIAVGIWTNSDWDFRLRNFRATNLRSGVFGGNSGREIAADSDFNLTDEATAPTNWGASSITSATVDYVDASNATLTSRDYRLQSSTDDGYEAGDDLSADFSVDIENTTRTAPWDIGAHELSVTGTGPAAPSGVTVSNPTTSSLDVSWTDNTGGSNDHNVYFREGGEGGFSLFGTVPAGTTSETVDELADGTTYDIAVASDDGAEESPLVSDSGTTTTETPQPPINVTVTAFTDTTATLEWGDPNSGTANPRMYQRPAGTGPGNWTFVTQLGTSATSYQFTGLSNATQYDLGVSYV